MSWTDRADMTLAHKIATTEDLKAILALLDEYNRCAETHIRYGTRQGALREVLKQRREIHQMHKEICRVYDRLHTAATATEVIERWALLEGER